VANAPYVYPGTDVLRNRFGVRDAAEACEPDSMALPSADGRRRHDLLQREVNKFYGQTGWRIVESTWVGPAHPNGWDGDYKGDLNDDEILECNALDDDAVPAWLLVHTDFKTILWGTEYVPNPHYRAKIVSRRLHREFLREMNPNTAHRDAEPEVTDEQTGNARKQRR
jgi:hypothetical protein